jgi:NAD kinase
MMLERALGRVLMGKNGKHRIFIDVTSTDITCRLEINPGDYITISASRYPFASVMSEGKADDWVDSISRTLQWNSRKKQKAFSDTDVAGK